MGAHMFAHDYMLLALAAGILVGVSAPLLGTLLVYRRISLIGDGLGHVAFAGVAIGGLLNIAPIWAACIVTVAGALLIDELRARFGTSGDLALAILFYLGLAVGVVVASASGALNAQLFSVLFGSILTVTWAELIQVAVVAVVVAAIVLGLRRALFVTALSDDLAKTAGLPVRWLNRLVLVLVALTVVIGMRLVGVLMIAALLVLPVATAQLVCRSFAQSLAVGSIAGGLSVVAGLTVAYYGDIAPGGSIVLAAIALFLITGVAARLRVGIARTVGGSA